jgi:hypothetical protein
LRRLSVRKEDHGAAVVSAGVFRIELDRLVEIGDGAVVFALFRIGAAAVAIGPSVFRIDLDRLAVVGDGTVVVALSP